MLRSLALTVALVVAPAAAQTRTEAVGWWTDPSGSGGADGAPQTALQRMNALLRRQLNNENEQDLRVYSYDTEAPSVAPTPVPSPLPTPAPSSAGNSTCPEGTFEYNLALFDYGGNGWQGGEYILSQFLGKPELEITEEVAQGTMEEGSEQIESFCLENGNYNLYFGGGAEPGEMGVQWLPDDVQKQTNCRGPCDDPAMMVDGLVLDVTISPTTFTPAPTSISAAADTWHKFSVEVEGVPDELFPPDETTNLIVQAATNDVLAIVSDNEQVMDTVVTLINRRKLQASDDRHQVDLTINMGKPYKTCAQVGFTSADDCLNGEGFLPPSLVENMDEAIESGLYAERLKFWGEYYGRAFPDGISVVGVLPEPEPEWIYAPTPAPTITSSPTGTMAPTAAQTVVSMEPTPGDSPTPIPSGTPNPTSVEPEPTTSPAPAAKPTVSPQPTTSPKPTHSPQPTISAQPTPDGPAKRKKKKKSDDGLSTGEIVGLVVGLVLACLICLLCGLYFKQRERSASIRKDSWDISTMFTDEQNLPDDPNEAPAGTDVADDVVAAGETEAQQPQALQKITQAAEL
mmetsp:Transcript_16362/g.49253  ORF Transcript_16362/g.49253 Transcript_16362/m.49253 type:complete len:571 (+) Transcript_16362:157-1869(+)